MFIIRLVLRDFGHTGRTPNAEISPWRNRVESTRFDEGVFIASSYIISLTLVCPRVNLTKSQLSLRLFSVAASRSNACDQYRTQLNFGGLFDRETQFLGFCLTRPRVRLISVIEICFRCALTNAWRSNIKECPDEAEENRFGCG